ncbi:MAG TPA: rod shape-determining protein [Candidatus Woesebacteria bacterium]|nr:rod shape-determining protein [Candidatus Woesebacteria bacterium]HPR14256.1 rod shape-determining protein [Candidatus Woesebacteria bacterium]
MPKSLDSAKKSYKPSLWQRLDWRQALAIDLGSNEIRIFRANLRQKKQMEVLNIDQACVAIKRGSPSSQAKVLAIGRDALEMRERLGDEVEVIFPIIAGRIIDEKLAKLLLRELLKRALRVDRILPFVISPVVVVTVKAGTSEFSRRCLSRLFYDLGASEVHLLLEPLAAAIGVGVPIADASGVMLMQMGAVGVEAAALSLGSVVSFQSNLWTGTVAGWELDELLRAYLVKKYHLLVTLEASESLKKRIILRASDALADDADNADGVGDDGSDDGGVGDGGDTNHAQNRAKKELNKQDQDLPTKDLITLVGRDLISQKAKTITVSNQELVMAIKPVIEDYIFLIERLMEEMPNALLVDVLDRGLLLSGNLAKLPGLDQFLAQALKMPVALVDDPDLAVATGALTVLENLELFKASLAYA